MNVKNIILFLGQLLILYSINEIGYLIANYFPIPLPGNVVGMMILFFLLWSGLLKLEWIQKASSFLLKHLVFFFIPITVGVMTLGDTLIKHGLSLLFILLVSTAIGMITTGRTAQYLLKKEELT